MGDYVLLEQLGEGSQGVVWKARAQQAPEIVVALKTLRATIAGDLTMADQLRRDARAIARMKHEHIIRTFHCGEYRGRWFFVLELMEGRTVAERLASYTANPRSAAVLMEKVARAIHHAHTRNPGVLHLDLKPGNILLTAEGEPKVSDFGLCMRLEAMAPLVQGPMPTCTGEEVDVDGLSATFQRAGIVGTLPYISTEMAGGRWSDISTASDVYGLGAVLYAMLTGREPYRGRDARETLSLVLRGDLARPRSLNPGVDRELEAVCLKCLDREPGRRYGSADALANDLRRWLDRRPTLAGGKPSAAREVRFWARRHPLRLASAGLVALLLWLIGLAIAVAELRRENALLAERLAKDVDRELLLIRFATKLLAMDQGLRQALASFPAQAERRREAVEGFLHEAIEAKNLFGIAGENPLVNVFVLQPDGVLLADTEDGSKSIGKSYRVRDYYQALAGPGHDRPRDDVYVARSFQSQNDDRYKIAVSTRIWGDDGKLMGILVANFTIGPRLIALDMTQEPDATVLCPMDESDPVHDREDRHPPWPYISVLDRSYQGSPKDSPLQELESSWLRELQRNPNRRHASEGPLGGRIVDYHRVGETHMIVKLSRRCPWPLSWLPVLH
ncbi:MAG: serine/threonine protein kinase [Isosphaeraceae bacterium]